MGGIEASAGARAADWDEIQRRQAASCGSAPATRTERSPARDATAIPEAVRNYDPSMFANPALGGATPVVAKPVTMIASGPDPLPPAADAFHGIQLLCLADDLPSMTRTDAKNAFNVGPYRMQPAVRGHEDGSVSVLYWVAVNREAKRGEFVVGPGELETFKAHAAEYERAGATAYMNGEPNEWQRQSLKTVDDAMRARRHVGPTIAQSRLARGGPGSELLGPDRAERRDGRRRRGGSRARRGRNRGGGAEEGASGTRPAFADRRRGPQRARGRPSKRPHDREAHRQDGSGAPRAARDARDWQERQTDEDPIGDVVVLQSRDRRGEHRKDDADERERNQAVAGSTERRPHVPHGPLADRGRACSGHSRDAGRRRRPGRGRHPRFAGARRDNAAGFRILTAFPVP